MVKFFKNFYLYLILFFLYAPILVLAIFSFNNSKLRVLNNFKFSFKPYADLFADKTIMNALFVTLSVAILSAAVSTVFGTLSAIGLFKSKKAVRGIILSATYLPMMNSDIVTGISLMLMFTALKIKLGGITLLLSHITFCIPYVISSVMPKLFDINQSMYEAAQDLGASKSYAYKKIIIPEIMPGIVSGFLLSITLSIDDFLISYYNTGGGVQNISTLIYSYKSGIPPKINALSTIIFALLLSLMLIINRKSGKNKK